MESTAGWNCHLPGLPIDVELGGYLGHIKATQTDEDGIAQVLRSSITPAKLAGALPHCVCALEEARGEGAILQPYSGRGEQGSIGTHLTLPQIG